MNHLLIQFANVSKKFGQNIVLKDANLSVYQGEIITVIGKSGVGKSVLLKHIIGLMKPDSGKILFQGRPLSEMSKGDRKALRRKFSYMFQSTALLDSMTVFENIALPLTERTSLPETEIQKRVRDKMDQFDLQEIDDKYPSQLSGGMKKRVALARALVTDPECVLFDEPTTGLDPIRKNAVYSMISDYQKRFGFTGVVVSHEIPDVFYISQRLAMLHEGRILFEGSPKEIQQVSNPVVRQFIGGLESRHDSLTDMDPQPQGEKRFNEEMARLKRHQIAFSLILFTVENLEEIYEKVGYVAAQTAIKNFAAELKGRLRITDICYRYDLNKIIVVLHNTNMDQARMACAKLAREMKINKILGIQHNPEFNFSVSVGFAEAQKDSPFEKVFASAESRQNMFNEFRVY